MENAVSSFLDETTEDDWDAHVPEKLLKDKLLITAQGIHEEERQIEN